MVPPPLRLPSTPGNGAPFPSVRRYDTSPPKTQTSLAVSPFPPRRQTPCLSSVRRRRHGVDRRFPRRHSPTAEDWKGMRRSRTGYGWILRISDSTSSLACAETPCGARMRLRMPASLMRRGSRSDGYWRIRRSYTAGRWSSGGTTSEARGSALDTAVTDRWRIGTSRGAITHR